MKYYYFWYKKELLDILNKNGYVHFYTKEQAKNDDFIDGKAFYFCIENKTYGYVNVIPYSEFENIKENVQYLENL